MTETTTPTGDVDQDSSDIRDESLLENETNEETTAVEENEDTDDSSDAGSESDATSNEEREDEDNSDIAAFAKSQGYDADKLTQSEAKLLRQLRKQSVAQRKEIDQKASKKLDDETKELYKPGTDDDRLASLEKRQALSEAREAKQSFWDSQDAGDRKYEAKMAEILAEERKNYGDEAARSLSKNLPRLLREAKYAEGAFSSDAARDAGRREEREDLRKKQEGAADRADATTQGQSSDTKVNREWLESTYDPSNPEHIKLVDEALARGELY